MSQLANDPPPNGFLIGILLVTIALLSLLILGTAAGAQGPFPTTPTVVIYPAVVGEARATLEKDWNDSDAYQPERGYCVTEFVQAGVPTEHGQPGYNIWIVVKKVVPASDPSNSTRRSMVNCPPGQPTLHTHPPATCDRAGANCTLGGEGAYECAPSRQDLESLILLENNWGIIQCDRHAFRFFYPFELRFLSQSDTSKK